MSGMRRRNRWIRAHHQQGPHAARLAEPIEHRVGGLSRRGQTLFRDSPNLRDVRSMGRIVDPAIPWKLISLLPVLAPALTVALARERAEPTTESPGLAQREGQVDISLH